MTTYMNISVSSSDIGSEMEKDYDFSYDILSEVAYYLGNDKHTKFIKSLFENAAEEENTTLLHLFEEIHNQFIKDEE